MAKAVLWALPDAEERKHGERTGLDTLVVHAVNVVYLMYPGSTPAVSKLTR